MNMGRRSVQHGRTSQQLDVADYPVELIFGERCCRFRQLFNLGHWKDLADFIASVEGARGRPVGAQIPLTPGTQAAPRMLPVPPCWRRRAQVPGVQPARAARASLVVLASPIQLPTGVNSRTTLW